MTPVVTSQEAFDEDALYRRVRDSDRSHARCGIELARECGVPRRHVEAMVNRAAERDSWRIAGMSPPTPGAVMWIYTGRAKDHLGWRAEVQDGEGGVHHLGPQAIRAYLQAAIDERPGIEIPDEVRVEAMRPYHPESAVMTKRKGGEEPTEKWTPSDALIEAQPDQPEIRRCAVCRKPIPSQMRADAEVCSPKHRRLLHRLRKGDPTVHEAIRMETNPPSCLGCGKPLFGKRAGTKVHNDYCRHLARKRRAEGPRSGGTNATPAVSHRLPTVPSRRHERRIRSREFSR